MREQQLLAGYATRPSVAQGEPLRLHVASATAPACAVDLYRVVGCEPDFTLRLELQARAEAACEPRYGRGVGAGDRLGPGDADLAGCRWPAQTVLEAVPEDWPSGLYLAQLTTAERPTGRPSDRLGEDVLLIVRPAQPGSVSRTLVQVSVATWSAYHIWRDRNLYIGDVDDPTGAESTRLRAHRVSFHRPGLGLSPTHNIPWWPPKGRLYVPPLIEWLTSEQRELEWCSGLDLHDGTVSLEPYRLLVTVGHDEYWSARQRDVVEAFTAGGGNAAFLGGNLAHWQIRYDDDGAGFACYKRDVAGLEDLYPAPGERLPRPLDPQWRDPQEHPEHDNSDVTVQFWSDPLHRSAASMTGASMQHGDGVVAGAAWWWENLGGPARPPVGFTVLEPDHWLFDGTGLRAGDVFGVEQKLVGYECDGVDVAWADGRPEPSGREATPAGLELLAYADCRDWGGVDYVGDEPTPIEGTTSRGGMGGVATLVSFTTPGGGAVVTTSVTDWANALVSTVDYTRHREEHPPVCPPSEEVRQITRNVLERLGR